MAERKPAQPQRTTRADYDFAGLPTSRMMANYLRWRLMPFGYLDNGPRFRWLLTAWLRHRVGLKLATLRIRHKKWFDRLVQLIARLRARQ